MIKKRKNKFIIVLLLVALISGIFWGFAYKKDPRPEFSGSADSLGYDRTALLVLEKGVFSATSNSDRPLYPIFLAGIYKVFGQNYHWVTVIQIFLFILTVLLVYYLCQMIFSENIARFAGLFTALCYSIASFSGWLYREVVFTFLIVLLIYSLYKAQLTYKNIWFIVSGLAAGLALLTNSVIQFFILIIIVNFFVICRKKGFKKIYLKVSLFFIALALIVGPWTIGGFLSFTSTGGGYESLLLRERVEKMENLEGKYFQHFIGNTLGDFFARKWFPDYNPTDVRHGLQTWLTYNNWIAQGKDSSVIDQIFFKEAKEFIPRHPIMFLKQTSIDFLKFNTPMTPNIRMQKMFVTTHPELSDFTKASIILFIRFIYLIFFILIIYGMVKTIRNWSKMSWLILIVLYFNLVFSFIHAIARYSVPIYPFYIILASIGLLSIWHKLKKQK